MLKLNHDSLYVYTFKWGSKYGPEYVNRLYKSLQVHCKIPFKFHCVTDNKKHINSDIYIIDYNTFNKTNIFTLEKIELMHQATNENNLILDLDILIHNDITDMCSRVIDKPTFIYTHWTPQWHWEKLVPKKTACFINSSFVRWSGKNAQFLWQHYLNEKSRLEIEYQSCDKYLFYEHYMKDKSCISFWEEGRFYNYNETGATQYKYNASASCCLFNTSHLIKMGRKCYELSETPDWSADIWESYDD